MKLYWAPKSRAFRAAWMLEESGAPYERVLVDIRAGQQSTPEFARINPMQKVPALTDGEATVAESAAICAYVAERVPGAGLAPPMDSPLRGRYWHLLFFAASCIEGAFLEKFANVSPPGMSAGWGSLDRVMDALEGFVTPGPWVLGEQFTAADVMIGADLYYGIELFGLFERRPAFAAYLERITKRPAFQRALAFDEAG
ncbi:MAG: glutathione S-transferase family protein [Alphaproteobacteria bacterium]|nr:glutathione S-transferase family protein [Alphaproteobacteria bacterium]